MDERQRTVAVVASGLALAVVAITINRLLSNPFGGWFAYAPNTSASFAGDGWPSDSQILRDAAVWLATIAAWTGLALWLYRKPASVDGALRSPTTDPSVPPASDDGGAGPSPPEGPG